MSTHTLTLEKFHPARLNQLLGRHWGAAARLKRRDRDLVYLEALRQGVPPARGRRRVSLLVTLGPKQRAGDPDAYWKSLLDALTHAGLLLDDNRQGVELGDVAFARGACRRTEVTLTDLEGGG